MVTGGAEVIVGALCAFPPDPDDGLLPTGVTHGAIVLDSCNIAITLIFGSIVYIIGN